MMRSAAMTLALVLAGCAPRIVTACPPLVEYSPAFQDRLAGELAALPEGAATLRAVQDYIGLRDQIRACQPQKGLGP